MQGAGSADGATPAIAVGGRRGSPLGPVPGSYLRALATAGARPVVLAPSREGARAAERPLAPCRGLLLTGGNDVAPELYGGQPGGGRDDVDPLRDACELALLEAAAARALPVLAICHGMQLVNVARGGSLAQQLDPTIAAGHGTSAAWREHAVRLRSGSRLAAAVGTDALRACSSHHQQAVARLGEGLVETGWSDDGLVEAIEEAGARWIVGVQWHPEDTSSRDAEQQRIFEAFVAAARGAERRPSGGGTGGLAGGGSAPTAGAGPRTGDER
ncbi:MAG TPA: gamma-glutamyl-gamma-aminobutyrate hydrolase family protein [Conexibacter sp.]|nr:gamma-glutamyl-gamma-aminobutyrate hydrolase family protein [Conexibacter sp.]